MAKDIAAAAQDTVTDVTNQVSTWVQQLKELAINNGLNCVYAIVILIFGIWFAGIFGRSITKFMTNRKIDPTISKFVGNIIKYGIIAFVAIAALGRIGIATASFVAVLGAAGLAIGLALQGSLSNFASGVMLICFRPIKVGEYVTGGGAEGTVQEISIFSTTILTVDNKVIVVPNSSILNGNIVNFSRMPERRVDMSFSVSYGADFREVKKLLTKIADSNDKIIHDDKHAYGIVVTDLAAPVMKIAVRVWVKNADYFDVLGKFTEDAKLAFDANKIAPAAVPSLNVLNSK